MQSPPKMLPMPAMKRFCPLLAASLLLSAAACDQTARPLSQFGAYPEHPKQLRLRDGRQFAVYRVKYWHFYDGSPPALQLEYDPRLPVTDTGALRRQLAEIWPAFGPYVEAAHLKGAIITATNINTRRAGFAWTSTVNSFGFITHQDSAGMWRLEGDGTALPPAEAGGPPRILEANGAPLLMSDIARLAREQPQDTP
jgi:hypothetical protein